MRTQRYVMLALAAAVPAVGSAQLFDFEAETPTYNGGGRPGALTSLTMNSGGVTITITRSSGGRFDLVNNAAAGQTGKPAGWGNVSLDPFFAEQAGDYFVAMFSHYVGGVTMRFGDYGGDLDNGFLRGYSGVNNTGALLDSTTQPFVSAFPNDAFLTISTNGPMIRSIAFGNMPGDAFVPSLFFDNIQLRNVAVPGPAAAIPFALGLIARRRRRK